MLTRLGILALIVASAFLLPQLTAAVAWDQAAISAVAAIRRPPWTEILFFITRISDTRGFLVALLAPTLIFFFKKRWATGLWYLVGVGLLKLSISVLKDWIGRSRPLGGLDFEPTLSMPSGHAANAVIMFGLLGVFLWPRLKSGGSKALVGAGCLLGIAAVGFSRVYIAVHYPSDVLVGTLYTATGLWILQGLRKDVFTL